MRKRRAPVLECIHDAGAEVAADLRDDILAEVPPHDVATERKGQTRVLEPPGTEVLPEMEPIVRVRQLALMDEKPDVHTSRVHRILDLVERHDDGLELRLVEPEREVRRGEEAGNRDSPAAKRGARVGRGGLARDEAGAVAVT